MPSATRSVPRRGGARSTVLLVLILSVLWLLFSGKYDLLHLAYGVLSIALVVLLTRNLVVAQRDPAENDAIARLHWPKLLVYPVWLVTQIVIANIQVSWIIVRPSIPVDPVLITFRSGMRSAVAKVTLGNSITLTPGTFTLRIRDDEFLVHSIHPSLAGGILDGSMQRKVAALFGEEVPDDLQVRVLRERTEVDAEVARWTS